MQLLVTHGLHLITKLRKRMRHRLLDWSYKLLLHKRATTQTINDQLKNNCPIEHSRHRSPINFLVNLVTGLIASCHQPKKPSLADCNHLLYQRLNLFPNSHYYTFLATNMSLKDPALREKYLADVDWSETVPYFSHSFGVSLAVVTSDGYTLFTQRGKHGRETLPAHQMFEMCHSAT